MTAQIIQFKPRPRQAPRVIALWCDCEEVDAFPVIGDDDRIYCLRCSRPISETES